jgi:hypothetical protein
MAFVGYHRHKNRDVLTFDDLEAPLNKEGMLYDGGDTGTESAADSALGCPVTSALALGCPVKRIQNHKFRIGDQVLMRDADDEEWKDGIVASVSPTMVLFALSPEDGAFKFEQVKPRPKEDQTTTADKDSYRDSSPSGTTDSDEELVSSPSTSVLSLIRSSLGQKPKSRSGMTPEFDTLTGFPLNAQAEALVAR